MKNIKQLASELAKREGKKSQARIGDIREILGILSDLFIDDPLGVFSILLSNGSRRRMRKKK